jgi:hypothetical protein
MPANQDEYEKNTRDEIVANVDEINRIAASIEAAAKVGRPLPITVKEFLKKISPAIADCHSVVDEHAKGYRFFLMQPFTQLAGLYGKYTRA